MSILGRGMHDQESEAFTILGINQDGLRNMGDFPEAPPKEVNHEMLAKKFLPAEELA
jgi:hypothetical protein